MVIEKLKSFSSQCARVWHLLKKPSTEEFKKVSIVAAIGLGLIGLIGFAIAIVMKFIPFL